MLALTFACAGCGQRTEPDPVIALGSTELTTTEHERAMEKLDAGPHDAAAKKALEAVISRPGYTVKVREKALGLLASWDEQDAKTTLRRSIPNSEAWEWKARVSQIVVERNWIDLTPMLISSWAARQINAEEDLKRPEYVALCKLHGQDRVIDVVYDTFMKSKGAGEQNLRIRCWQLLNRLGQRERLRTLIVSGDIPPDDAMLLDLRAAAHDLGILPNNKEEILWLRKLREPSRAEFWSRAVQAIAALPDERRLSLELRDIPIIVSASIHDPELLEMSKEQLYQQVYDYVHDRRHHVQESDYNGYTDTRSQRLYEYRDELTWGDLAAMAIAIRAIKIPQVVAHLFNFADRDRADTSTEYGGVIALDAKDRFEIKEFVPTVRKHDGEFLASQALFDALYTSIFHFHLHVQYERNERFAGPGYGDSNFADNSRANCLVFTSISDDTLNIDYYRHDRIVVDLGDIKRP